MKNRFNVSILMIAIVTIVVTGVAVLLLCKAYNMDTRYTGQPDSASTGQYAMTWGRDTGGIEVAPNFNIEDTISYITGPSVRKNQAAPHVPFTVIKIIESYVEINAITRFIFIMTSITLAVTAVIVYLVMGGITLNEAPPNIHASLTNALPMNAGTETSGTEEGGKAAGDNLKPADILTKWQSLSESKKIKKNNDIS